MQPVNMPSTYNMAYIHTDTIMYYSDGPLSVTKFFTQIRQTNFRCRPFNLALLTSGVSLYTKLTEDNVGLWLT